MKSHGLRPPRHAVCWRIVGRKKYTPPLCGHMATLRLFRHPRPPSAKTIPMKSAPGAADISIPMPPSAPPNTPTQPAPVDRGQFCENPRTHRPVSAADEIFGPKPLPAARAGHFRISSMAGPLARQTPLLFSGVFRNAAPRASAGAAARRVPDAPRHRPAHRPARRHVGPDYTAGPGARLSGSSIHHISVALAYTRALVCWTLLGVRSNVAMATMTACTSPPTLAWSLWPAPGDAHRGLPRRGRGPWCGRSGRTRHVLPGADA